MKDIHQELFKETIAEFFENGLKAELDEELGYSKYDYRHNKPLQEAQITGRYKSINLMF